MPQKLEPMTSVSYSEDIYWDHLERLFLQVRAYSPIAVIKVLRHVWSVGLKEGKDTCDRIANGENIKEELEDYVDPMELAHVLRMQRDAYEQALDCARIDVVNRTNEAFNALWRVADDTMLPKEVRDHARQATWIIAKQFPTVVDSLPR